MQNLYLKTTKYCWKTFKKIWINEKTSHVHGREDLILLRWQYPQINLWSQCNLDQNPYWLLHRNGQADLKIQMETQGTPKSQNNLGKGELSWKTFTSWFLKLLKAVVIEAKLNSYQLTQQFYSYVHTQEKGKHIATKTCIVDYS